MKYLTLVLCLQSGFVLSACLEGDAGAKKLFIQEFSGTEKSLEVSTHPSRLGDVLLVKDPATCGMKSCDLILAHADDKKCLRISFSGNGRVRSQNKNDYSEVIFEPSHLAVDTKKSVIKTLQLNTKTNLFEEKITK